MALPSFVKILQLPLMMCAGLIRFVNINRVTFETVEGTEYVRKSRSRFSWVLITIGNLVFRLRLVPVQVLYTRTWLQWETSLAQAIRNETLTPAETLVVRKLPGESLASVLRHGDDEVKWNAMIAATRALVRLHSAVVDSNGMDKIRASHGDASTLNALYDAESGIAAWFDFDLRHALHIPADRRHADDLRSLLFTAGAFFPIDQVDRLVDCVRQEYANPVVWNELKKQITSLWFIVDLFHLSQVRRRKHKNGVLTKDINRSNEILVQAIMK